MRETYVGRPTGRDCCLLIVRRFVVHLRLMDKHTGYCRISDVILHFRAE